MYYCSCLYLVVNGYLRLVSDNYLMFHAYISWNSHMGEYLCTEYSHNSVPTAKGIPVRPSVSSITLGVTSPTGVSSIGEQYMCSRKNYLNPNVDERWGGLWAKFDSAPELNENVTITEKDDWPKKSEEFYYLSEKELKEDQETDTGTADKSQIVK